MFCKYCGKQLDDDSKFCCCCGKQLDAIVEQNVTDKIIERVRHEFQEEIDIMNEATTTKYKEEEEKQKQINDTIAAGISIAAGWKLGKALSDLAGYKKK